MPLAQPQIPICQRRGELDIACGKAEMLSGMPLEARGAQFTTLPLVGAGRTTVTRALKSRVVLAKRVIFAVVRAKVHGPVGLDIKRRFGLAKAPLRKH